MDLLSCRDYLIEIIDDGVAFCLGYTNYGGDKPGVEEERFPASDRMSADQRMLRDNWVPTYRAAKGMRSISLNLC